MGSVLEHRLEEAKLAEQRLWDQLNDMRNQIGDLKAKLLDSEASLAIAIGKLEAAQREVHEANVRAERFMSQRESDAVEKLAKETQGRRQAQEELYQVRNQRDSHMDRRYMRDAYEALDAIAKEFRALDLPYGSTAYAKATALLNELRPYLEN